jgi:hypothetical protein
LEKMPSANINADDGNKPIDLSKKLQVERSPTAFGSRAVSLVSLPAGSVFTKITGYAPNATKAYSSVQVGRDAHIELHSELLYCNHSCDPSVVFDMARFEVRVVDHKPLKSGDALTFFYPSTEWEMAQPFECTCGAKNGLCKGTIRGAGAMAQKDLDGYWINAHIRDMLEARKAKDC